MGQARPLLLLALGIGLAAVRAEAQGFAHNKLEFMNWWIEDREDLFPNFLKPSGNLPGDGLFKVFPAEILERAGSNRISGYELGLSIDDAYTLSGPLPVFTPGVQLFRTQIVTLAGKTYETLDPTRKVGIEFDPVRLVLPSDGSWVVEVAFDPQHTDPKLKQLLEVPALVGGQRAGLALMALAPVGEKRDPGNPGIVMQASYLERHVPPGRTTYSGSYDAGTQTIRMYGTPGMPSASGELYVGLRMHNPVLQLYGSSAGGYHNDPQGIETFLGPGAYATDLASGAAGTFGLWVQAESYDTVGPATHRAYPFIVSTSAAGPSATLGVFGVAMRFDPASLAVADAFIQGGLWGDLKRYTAFGVGGWDLDQRGVWTSGKIALAPSPALIGVNLWLQALITTVSLQPVDATNVVRLTLR